MSDRPPEVAAIGADEGDVWDELVRARPEASYCHLHAWRAVAESAYGRRCLYLVARTGSRISGVLPLVWMPGRLGGRRLVSMPYLDLGGPVAADGRVREALIATGLDHAGRLGAGALELREEAADATTETTRYRFLLELPDDPGELWRRLGPKVRNQIRKSEKEGLATRRAEPARLTDFYRVFARNMRDLGSPVHSRRFYASIFHNFGDRAHLYLTTGRDGRCVAGAVAIAFREQLVVPWASALRSERRRCPNHSLYWRILRQAIQEGATRFDFGRSSVGSGTYRFKKQWGASPEPLGWRLVDAHGERPAGGGLSARRNSLLVALWSRLPLPLANLLGPRIRGRLPH